MGEGAAAGQGETSRELLHRVVAHAAAKNATSETFLAVLRDSGVDPVADRDAAGRIVGYTVALPYDSRRDGTTIRYSGRALAPDLTWPKLQARWASATGDIHPGYRPARRSVQGAERRTA